MRAIPSPTKLVPRGPTTVKCYKFPNLAEPFPSRLPCCDPKHSEGKDDLSPGNTTPSAPHRMPDPPAAIRTLSGMHGWVNERQVFMCGPLDVTPGLSCVVGSLSFKIQLRHYFPEEAPTVACLSTFGLEASPVHAQSFFIPSCHSGPPLQELGVGLTPSNVSFCLVFLPSHRHTVGAQ